MKRTEILGTARNIILKYKETLRKESNDLREIAKELGKKSAMNVQQWKEPLNSQDSPIDLIDLFCGCGGVSTGFLAINEHVEAFRLIGAIDIDPDSTKTFEQLGFSPQLIDIRDLLDDNALKSFLSDCGYEPSRPLILIGCPPCQGFSSHRKKNWDTKDERNDLVEVFAEVAAKIHPDYIFMENVPELLSRKYWVHYMNYKNILEKAGYNTAAAIVNMAEFALPQERNRAIVLSSLSGVSVPASFLSPSQFRTVRDAIGGLEKIEPSVPSKNDPFHMTANHKKSTINVIKQIPKNGGSRPKGVGPKCLDKVKGFSDVYGRLRWDEPSITITGYARNPASGRYVHPEQDRGLSIREAAILQGFPNYTKFKGSFDSIFQQIGNAVPPLFSSYIASHILGDISEAKGRKVIEKINIVSPVSNSYSSVIAGCKMKRRNSVKQEPLAIEVFSGAGGLSIGLEKAGFKLCFAYDNDPKAVETYKKNIGDHVIRADAYDINIDEELRNRGISSRDVILFAGGPPCQGFSIQRRGDDSDPRNNLVKVFFEQAFAVRPNYILMENVLGISGHRGKELVGYIRELCGKEGYYPHFGALNAADFGVPQIRKRFFVVAERLDGKLPMFDYPKPLFTPDSYNTVRDAIGDLPSPPSNGSEYPTIPNHRCDRLSEINRKRFECVPQSGGRENIPDYLRLPCHKVSADKAGHRYVFGRLDWNKPAGVITARFDSLTRGRFGHPIETRTISLREGARLQTFQDDFIFYGTKVQVARQIGNAVPPILAEALGKSILDSWNRKTKFSKKKEVEYANQTL